MSLDINTGDDMMTAKRKKKGDGPTPPVQFRLGDDVTAKLDEIAEHLGEESGNPHTRSDAVRVAIQQLWLKVRKAKKPDEGGAK